MHRKYKKDKNYPLKNELLKRKAEFESVHQKIEEQIEAQNLRYLCNNAYDLFINYYDIFKTTPNIKDFVSKVSKIRQQESELKNLPIIMLTALGELQDKIKGFSTGVDDYLTKPFEIEELKARVLALLNRSGQEISSLRIKEILSTGDITLIPESYTVQILDKQTQLTPIEFDILNVLVQNEGTMVSSKTLLKEVWGYENEDDIDTIRVHITHLRSKINKISSEKNKYIQTIYGGGYRLLTTGVEKD